MKCKVYTQEEIREQICEYLKDCNEEVFMNVAKVCFEKQCPEFEQEKDECGFRKISMFD